MSMTKLFKLLCILPVLIGCEQGAESSPNNKEQLILFGFSEELGEKIPEKYSFKKINGLEGTLRYADQPRYDVTPKELAGVFKLYARRDSSFADILIYEDELYAVNMQNTSSFNRFAYYNNGEKEALYYSRDIGSGRHILQIGAFNFKEKQDMAVDIGYNDYKNYYNYFGVVFDLVTHVSSNKKMLGARSYTLNDDKTSEQKYVVSDGLLYEDLTTYQFASWDKFKPQQ